LPPVPLIEQVQPSVWVPAVREFTVAEH
jgi:hypothetical protein